MSEDSWRSRSRNSTTMRVHFIETNIFRAPACEPAGAPGEGEIWLELVVWGGVGAGEFVEVSRCCPTRKPTSVVFVFNHRPSVFATNTACRHVT